MTTKPPQRIFPLGALLLIAACATSNGVTQHDAGNGGGGGDTTDAGSDAGMPMGDAIPASAVSFFQGVDCPKGWSPFTNGDGLLFLPVVSTATAGAVHGKRLSTGEDRQHWHLLSTTFTLPGVSYAGLGGGNNGVSTAGDVTTLVQTDPASSNLPYVQLLACRKNAAAVTHPKPLPHGMQMFFDMTACPAGWQQTSQTQGRFIVGLPAGAPQDLTFGGAPLASSDGGVIARPHTHPSTATLTTTSHGIALASGCCGDGYGANGTYTSMQDTDGDEVDLPYIELLACEKQ